MKYNKGFTLIELLVVIAIIGILSSVVLASLNAARTKGQIASIKSTLKNIIPQAELAYDIPGNYSAVLTDTKIASMLAAITNTGASTARYSYDGTSYSDVYLRWGASAIIGTSTPIKAYSVSSTGVTTWDTQGVNSSGTFVGTDVAMRGDPANTACATAGGRLPTIEELKTLSDATFIASGSTNHTPPSFVADVYWSSTTVPSISFANYFVGMSTGGVGQGGRPFNDYYVRCVR